VTVVSIQLPDSGMMIYGRYIPFVRFLTLEVKQIAEYEVLVDCACEVQVLRV